MSGAEGDPGSTQVLVSYPSVVPEGLLSRLSERLRELAWVEAAYLMQLHVAGEEQARLIVGISASEAPADATEALDRAFAGLPSDERGCQWTALQPDDWLSPSALQYGPFYVRAARRGFFARLFGR